MKEKERGKEKEESVERSGRVEKGVCEISDVLFTLTHCGNITFSSIAFIIQNRSLSHSLFLCIHAYLTVRYISITPSDSNTPTELTQSVIVSSSGSSVNMSESTFESVGLSGGNGAVINSRVGDECTFVVMNSSFTHCSAMNGGAVYVVISGEPELINMSNVGYSGNSASNEGNTLYVVWRSVESMKGEMFSSFEGASEDEAKVATGKGLIVGLGEFVSGGGGIEDCSCESWSGSEGEGKEGYKVCAQIKKEGNAGRVVVGVMKGKGGEREGEEEWEEGCVVMMEGGEVYVGVGGVNGGDARVDVGDALTRVLHQCESLEIVMNVTYGLSNG